MHDYPAIRTPVNHVEPVPRRIRAYLAGEIVLDTMAARYLWEIPPYPQYYIPLTDVRPGLLVDDAGSEQTDRGTARVCGLRVGDTHRRHAALVYETSPIEGIAGTVRFDWRALDSWFEEDEQVFVHPRDPFTRVDSLRSTRRVTVSLDGVELASSSSPVLVFETGLPTRYYLNRTDIHLEHLSRSTTRTACPYKGTTSGYWSAVVNGRKYEDIAWAYDFPTRELLPIAGLICFYNEKVDLSVDGRLLDRPITHFS